MNKKLEIELCRWYKMFPDSRCSITCQGFMEVAFRKSWGQEFKKHASNSKEERAKFVMECERKYGLKFLYIDGR